MKQKLKKFQSLFVAVILLLSAFPIAFAAEYGEVIETYACDSSHSNCDFSWVLYEDGTLVINGNGSLTNHNVVTENIVKKVIISDTVTELSTDVFLYLDTIENFEVSAEHPTYSCSDGVLFNKDFSVLLNYPIAKAAEDYVITETVKTIGCYAFYGAKIENVIMPKMLEKIENRAFYGAQVKSVVIPENVQTIAMNAFQCSMLESVSFESINRNLFIDSKAFADCENLTEINLNSQTVYAIVTDAFNGTAFYEDTANWECGVLYINDILLAVDETKMEKEYAVKEGTKVIADAIWHLMSGEESEGTEVMIPQSVDNFGMYSLTYDELLNDFFRIARIKISIPEELSNELNILLDKWHADFEINDIEKDITVDALKAFPEELLMIICEYADYVQFVTPLRIFYFNVEMYRFDDVKGFADEYPSIKQSPLNVVPTLCDSYIFSESVEWIGRFSPFNEIITNNFLASMYYDEDEELNANLAREKNLTFLNPDCYINDAEETIWHGYTICGYPDSTAYEYAMKYNRKFVDISNCIHDEISVNYYLEVTCSREGYTGDVYCQYCGEFLEEGTIIPRTENHFFGEWEIISYPSCVEDGTRKHVCELCGKEETGIYQTAYGHKYVEKITPATCTQSGSKRTTCENCSFYEYETLSATGHKDENNDYKCDACGEQLNIDCNCNCHKSGFMQFIYKIVRFFWRLFRINQVCSCGAFHY